MMISLQFPGRNYNFFQDQVRELIGNDKGRSGKMFTVESKFVCENAETVEGFNFLEQKYTLDLLQYAQGFKDYIALWIFKEP